MNKFNFCIDVVWMDTISELNAIFLLFNLLMTWMTEGVIAWSQMLHNQLKNSELSLLLIFKWLTRVFLKLCNFWSFLLGSWMLPVVWVLNSGDAECVKWGERTLIYRLHRPMVRVGLWVTACKHTDLVVKILSIVPQRPSLNYQVFSVRKC